MQGARFKLEASEKPEAIVPLLERGCHKLGPFFVQVGVVTTFEQQRSNMSVYAVFD